MDKVLKGVVALLFVLSIVAVSLEMKLYRQREEVKNRAVKLAESVVRIATTLEAPQPNADLAAKDAPRMQVSGEQLKQYYKVGADGKPETDAAGKRITTGPGTMDEALLQVYVSAGRQFDRLNDTRTGLELTRATLSGASNTLVKTEATLETTSNTLVVTERVLADTKQEVEKKTEEVTELTAKAETLQADAEKKADEVAKLSDKLSDKESQIAAGKRYIQKLEKELGGFRSGGGTNVMVSGLQGQVLVVNTNWNFVVMDLLPDSSLIPLTDLTVQRQDRLVGKIRVAEVLKDQWVAVGEVLTDWQQLPVAPGDYVFY
jgi:hypothetical protein